MTDAELDTEEDAIGLEHAALTAEYDRLKSHPGDVIGHIEYLGKMQAHVDRQKALIAARRARTPLA